MKSPKLVSVVLAPAFAAAILLAAPSGYAGAREVRDNGNGSADPLAETQSVNTWKARE